MRYARSSGDPWLESSNENVASPPAADAAVSFTGNFPQALLSTKAVSYRCRCVPHVYTRNIVKSHGWPSEPRVPTTRYCGFEVPEASVTWFSSNHATIRMSVELA